MCSYICCARYTYVKLTFSKWINFSSIQYYTHKDYAHTFRSKKEVQHFLDTGEVKGKGLLQKVSISTFVKLFKSFVPCTYIDILIFK